MSSYLCAFSHLNFNYLNTVNKFSRGEICVANFILPCNWCESK